jgi:glycosyltransferase involved in cell wall biosynthesis
MARIAIWPYQPHCSNPYQALFCAAVRHHGHAVVGEAEVNDEFLRRHAHEFDVLHLQWNVEDVWRTRGRTPWGQLRGVLGLWRFLRRARALGLRVVWTVHDLRPHERAGRIDWLGYALLARTADLCLCHSKIGREDFLQTYSAPPDRTVVVPHGNYDTHYPAPRPKSETLAALGLHGSKRTLLCCGIVRPYKRYDLAIRALRELGSDYQLVLAGSPFEDNYAQTLRECGQDLENVHLILRELSEQEVADLYLAADCVLLPYDRITSSGSALLTFSLGRGAVTSDLPLFRELAATDPEAVSFFPPGDATALAESIQSFFARSPVRRHAAARRIADRFAWEQVVRPYADWLHGLPSRTPRDVAVTP